MGKGNVGRPVGYKLSDDAKIRIGQSRVGVPRCSCVKKKISDTTKHLWETRWAYRRPNWPEVEAADD